MGCSVNMSWIRCGNGIYVPLACEIPQLPGEVRTSDLTLLNEQQYIMFSWPLVVIHAVWTGGTGLNIHSITSLSNTYLQHLTVYFIYGFGVLHWDTRLIRQADRVIPLCVCVCVFILATDEPIANIFCSFLGNYKHHSMMDGTGKELWNRLSSERKINFFSCWLFYKRNELCSVCVDWHFLYVFIFVLVNVFNTTIAAVFKRIVLRGFLIVMKNM